MQRKQVSRHVSTCFSTDLKQRFEDMVSWALEHYPQSDRPLLRSDFDKARQQIDQIAEGRLDIGVRNQAIPEPSENGPQYVNTKPAPWP